LLLGLGLAGAGAALYLRFRGGIEGSAVPLPRGAVLVLAGANGLLALGCAFLAVWSFRRLVDANLPWYTGGLVFGWLLAAAWLAALAAHFGRRAGERVGPRMEAAALLVLVALAAYLTRSAFSFGEARADEWDSMRLFFGVVTAATFAASAVVAAAPRLRRFLVSVLILFHFGGIATAVMATQPGPWLASYLWERVYQPYLEFMYLQNAYRFYSPEPDPATLLWFFVEYEDRDKAGRTHLTAQSIASQGLVSPGAASPVVPQAAVALGVASFDALVLRDKVHSRWLKVPDLGEDGGPRYSLSLRYQRRLALVMNVAKSTTGEPTEFRDENGNLQKAPYFSRRDDQAREPKQAKEVLGVKQEPLALGRWVPYHPIVPFLAQYGRPDYGVKQLLRCFARHVTRLPHPQHPGLKATSVKIYRVRHQTLEPAELGNGLDPNALPSYWAYYLGKYDPNGKLLDEQDPFLYWLLPTIPEGMDPTVPPEMARPDVVSVYAFLHAYGSEQAVRESGASWKFRVLRSGRTAAPLP
jgi:hypothetical protein